MRAAGVRAQCLASVLHPALRQVCANLETLGPLEFGTMTAHEFYLYESKLSPAGARYTKLSRYPLE